MARKLKSLNAKADLHQIYKTPCRIFDIECPASKKSPRKIAESILRKVAKDMDIAANLSQLRFEKAKETILGTQVLFQQYHDGKAISGAWVRVDIDKKGKVYNIQSDIVPNKFLERGAKASAAKRKAAAAAETAEITEAAAVKSAIAAAGAESSCECLSAESVFYPHEGIPTAAWKFILKNKKGPAGEWRVYVDAITGDVLAKDELLKHQDGSGKVFDPNPVVTLNDTSLEDSSNIPDSAYTEVVLQDLEDSGRLDGPFVSTRTTSNRIRRTNLVFEFNRSDRAFKEVMVYFHIDRVQRYIQELGFDNVLNKQIEVNIDGTTEDNSFYSPSTKALTFGTGGVDDAEDADIILHEYGHAMQDDMLPGFGPSGEARAMGEGFGDYMAASFFADSKAEALIPCVGTWDATSYSGDDPPNLRRVDSNKKYPRDLVGQEHNDGEIWSACLWEIRSALGRRTADRLIIAHHFQLPNSRASFEQAGNALITTDNVLNEGRNEAAIRDVFVRRGIFPNPRRKNRRAGASFHDSHKHKA